MVGRPLSTQTGDGPIRLSRQRPSSTANSRPTNLPATVQKTQIAAGHRHGGAAILPTHAPRHSPEGDHPHACAQPPVRPDRPPGDQRPANRRPTDEPSPGPARAGTPRRPPTPHPTHPPPPPP